METTVIPLSKTKTFLLLLGSLGFVIAGIFFIAMPDHFTSYRMPFWQVIFATGIVAVLFFGLCAVFIFKKLLCKSDGLHIDHTGIIDNSTAVSVGFIPWSDIEDIQTVHTAGQAFVAVYVRKPEHYIERQPGNFARKVLRSQYKNFGTPVYISANTLRINHKQLENLLKTAFREQNPTKAER